MSNYSAPARSSPRLISATVQEQWVCCCGMDICVCTVQIIIIISMWQWKGSLMSHTDRVSHMLNLQDLATSVHYVYNITIGMFHGLRFHDFIISWFNLITSFYGFIWPSLCVLVCAWMCGVLIMWVFFMPFKCSFYRFSDDYRGGGWPDCLKKCGRGGITDVNYIVCSDFS